ncbi:MAG: mechanosensitive ion channel [Opitutales bacterium]|nr:mechanosensitive ion channel [Opitutales bacterium]
MNNEEVIDLTWVEQQVEVAIERAPSVILQIVLAAVIFIAGKWIALKIRSTMRRTMEARNVDPVLVGFLSSLAYYALLIAVVIAAIGQLGIPTTSFVAVLGAAGLAVGFALSGSLSNFASGVLIILFRPFKVTDFVEAGGAMGIVEEIGILTTEMRTPDNKKIIVPNSAVMGGTITNFSEKPTRRVDLTYGVSYEDDLDKVIAIMKDVLAQDSRILPEPEPTIGVLAHGDSSIDLVCRPWVKKEDYWGVFFDLNLQMKKRFDAEGITIPFPQRDVHIYQKS